MASTITSLGHAGLDVRLGSTRVICDPWLSPGGAYLGSRHPFPRNDQLVAQALHDAPNLFISSPRPEHCDLETLRAFPKAVRVLIPAFPSKVLAEQVAALGFKNVVELAEGEPFDLGDGVTAYVLRDATRYVLRSTLVLRAGDDVVVDQNDCVLDAAGLVRVAGEKPALHLLSFSGSSYFPGSYQFPPETGQGHVAQQTERLFTQFLSAAQALDARLVVPMGPACFLDERGFPLNFGDSIFYDVDALLGRVATEAPALSGRLSPLYPGDSARGAGADWSFESKKPYTDKRAYLEAYRDARAVDRLRRHDELRAEAELYEPKELLKELRSISTICSGSTTSPGTWTSCSGSS